MKNLLSYCRSFFAEHSFTLIAVLLAIFAVGAYVSDIFMEAQLVFGAMGLWGPVLLIICGLAAALVGISYLLQEGNSLVQMFRELVERIKNYLRRLSGMPEPIKAIKLSDSDPDEAKKSPVVLSPLQKFLLGLGVTTGSGIAIGTAIFFSLTAFFGVVAVGELCGVGMFSPAVLSIGILVGVAQAMASIFQEGNNTVNKVITPLAESCKTTSDKLLDQFILGRKTAVSAAETTPSSAPVRGWRSYLPTRKQMLIGTSLFFAIIAVVANSSDIFMEAQFVFGMMGLSTPAGLIVLCSLVATAVALTYFCQEGLSIKKALLHWFDGEETKSKRTPVSNKVVRYSLLGGTRVVALAVAGFGGITAFFGVLSVAGAMGATISPAIIALAVIAAVAQASASLAQEGANMVTKFHNLLDAKQEEPEEDENAVSSPPTSPPRLDTSGLSAYPGDTFRTPSTAITRVPGAISEAETIVTVTRSHADTATATEPLTVRADPADGRAVEAKPFLPAGTELHYMGLVKSRSYGKELNRASQLSHTSASGRRSSWTAAPLSRALFVTPHPERGKGGAAFPSAAPMPGEDTLTSTIMT